MSSTVFWAGIVAPFVGLNLFAFLIRDFQRGEVERFYSRLLPFAGVKVIKRAESPKKFWFAVFANLLSILVLLVLLPLWAFKQ